MTLVVLTLFLKTSAASPPDSTSFEMAGLHLEAAGQDVVDVITYSILAAASYGGSALLSGAPDLAPAYVLAGLGVVFSVSALSSTIRMGKRLKLAGAYLKAAPATLAVGVKF